MILVMNIEQTLHNTFFKRNSKLSSVFLPLIAIFHSSGGFVISYLNKWKAPPGEIPKT